jgi:cell division protein FtsZ
MGENCASEVIESLIDTLTMENIASTLLFLQIHPDFPIMEISDAVDVIYGKTSEDTTVLLSLIGNDTLSAEEVRVSMIFTDFK